MQDEKDFFLEKVKKDYGKYPIDISVLENTLTEIFSTIESETLSQKEIDGVLSKLSSLSPRRTGTFLEVFNRENNGLKKPKSISHDAVLGENILVEIKTSRVYKDVESDLFSDQVGFYSLYNQLMNETRVFTRFEECLDANYDCNIQQIKTKEFDILNYCLFFKNVIIEFSMSRDEIKHEMIFKKLENLYKDLKDYNYDEFSGMIEAEINQLIFDKTSKGKSLKDKNVTEKSFPWKKIEDVLKKNFSTPDLKEILKKTGIDVDLYKVLNLKYSDKQHAGNEGEGQFHINKMNIVYHLACHYRCSYSYSDFIAVLKNQKSEK